MTNHTADWVVATSLGAFTFSKISMLINDQVIMEGVSSVSAVILCLTAILKFIDLAIEKWKKWKKTKPDA